MRTLLKSSKKLNKHSQALELFRTNHSNLEVAIQVGLTDSETEEEQKQFRRLINMDKFCEFYDAMKGDLEYHLQLYSELCNAHMTIYETIEGVRYAKSIDSIKLEYAYLQNSLKQIRYESFEAWKKLQMMKQEKHNLSTQSESLRSMCNANWNGAYLPEYNGISFLRARRRKRTYKSPDQSKADGFA